MRGGGEPWLHLAARWCCKAFFLFCVGVLHGTVMPWIAFACVREIMYPLCKLSVCQRKMLENAIPVYSANVLMSLASQNRNSAHIRCISARGDSLLASHPLALLRTLMARRDLLLQLLRRDTAARYRGTCLGGVWALVTPLLVLAVYTLVFGVIYQTSRFNGGVGDYALTLFCGFVPWWLFAEVVGGAPALILSRPSFVQKMSFPLEMLPVVHLGVSLFNSLAALVILFGALAVKGVPSMEP